MSGERWHVVGMDKDNRALYSATVQVELDTVPHVVSASVAIQVAGDRLRVNGYDPAIVVSWLVSRKCPNVGSLTS